MAKWWSNQKDIEKLSFGKTEKQIELDEINKKIDNYEWSIMEADYSYRTIRKLVRTIKRDHNIPGFRGMLIDQILPGESSY